jgi:hypothetical protein
LFYVHTEYIPGVYSQHGLQDPDITITLKNQQKVTIRMLLQSLPATQGMSRPQLFQLAETNADRKAIVVTYQKEDRELVHACLFTLQNDIVAQLASGEANRIFITKTEGITFRPLTKTKGGQIIQNKPTSQNTIEHVQHTKTILASPPKKRPYVHRSTDNNQMHSNSQKESQNQNRIYQTNIPAPTTYAAVAQQPHQQEHINNYPVPPPNSVHLSNMSDFSEKLKHRFLLIEEELKGQQQWNLEQREWNEDVILRMNYIEDTTTSTDNKVDAILSRLDSWDIPTKRRGVTPHNDEERRAPYPYLQEPSGDMEK